MNARIKSVHRLASTATLYRAFGTQELAEPVFRRLQEAMAGSLAKGETVVIRTKHCPWCGGIHNYSVGAWTKGGSR